VWAGIVMDGPWTVAMTMAPAQAGAPGSGGRRSHGRAGNERSGGRGEFSPRLKYAPRRPRRRPRPPPQQREGCGSWWLSGGRRGPTVGRETRECFCRLRIFVCGKNSLWPFSLPSTDPPPLFFLFLRVGQCWPHAGQWPAWPRSARRCGHPRLSTSQGEGDTTRTTRWSPPSTGCRFPTGRYVGTAAHWAENLSGSARGAGWKARHHECRARRGHEGLEHMQRSLPCCETLSTLCCVLARLPLHAACRRGHAKHGSARENALLFCIGHRAAFARSSHPHLTPIPVPPPPPLPSTLSCTRRTS
jgi:hypothetical protein